MPNRPTSGPWHPGDRVLITCQNIKIAGKVEMASRNRVSLMLWFGDAILDGHVGRMPVLLHDDGAYRSIVSGVEVQLEADRT